MKNRHSLGNRYTMVLIVFAIAAIIVALCDFPPMVNVVIGAVGFFAYIASMLYVEHRATTTERKFEKRIVSMFKTDLE